MMGRLLLEQMNDFAERVKRRQQSGFEVQKAQCLVHRQGIQTDLVLGYVVVLSGSHLCFGGEDTPANMTWPSFTPR